MKVLLVRFGVLGTVIVLGWLTIANGQRSNDPNPLRGVATAPSNSLAATDEPGARRPPSADPFGLQTRRESNSPTPAARRTRRDAIPDAADVGLQQGRSDATLTSRYTSRRDDADSADSASPGPALTSGESVRSEDDRIASRPNYRDATPNRAGSRYTRPAATSSSSSDAQEPPRFRADPSAMPANPMQETTPTRNSFGPITDNMRTEQPFGDADGVGQPGDSRLEGVQSPQLTIQKFAPKEVQVGKTATFQVIVRNTGSIPASQVEICDQVPRGAKLVGTVPQATRGTRGDLTWKLGTIRPGEEVKVEMQVMPTNEGEIGSVATVHFGADASARSVVTRPQLVVESSAPAKVMIGEQVTLSIVISNPGTGIATGVVLQEKIPAGLQHPAGAELEYQVGDLKPGESRKLELPLMAGRAGLAANLLSARGDGNLHAENECKLEVVAPQLDVVVEGPKRRYLERQATYQFSVTNPGTAAAKQVDLVAQLPPGLKFMSANNAGYYEEATRTVHWRLEELPANETGSVELVTMPIEEGQHALKLRGTADKGLVSEKEQPVLVEGIAAILFQVSDTVDPVEISGETTYDIRVVNQGSKASTNVRMTIDLPAELKPMAAEGPTRYTVQGNRISFDGLAQLPPKAETTYRVRVKAMSPGDLRARFQLSTDDMKTPVTKEESTRVYADE
jgi:uncharacterized repeat protein (TIGR01451 family)